MQGRRGYFISPAAVRARVMTPPTSMLRRFVSRGTGLVWRTGLLARDQSVAATSVDCRDAVAADGVIFGAAARTSRSRFTGLTDALGQAKEICDVIGRRDPRLDQERAFRAIGLVIAGQSERRAVGHVGDGVGLDDGLAVGIPPDLARMAVDIAGRHRR